jgi:hypothetical protein
MFQNPLQRFARRAHHAAETSPQHSELSLVFPTYLNGGLAIVAAGALIVHGISVGWAVSGGIAVFAVLLGALYHRKARWVSAAIGSLVAIGASAGIVWAFGFTPGALGVGAVLLALTGLAYWRILRA